MPLDSFISFCNLQINMCVYWLHCKLCILFLGKNVNVEITNVNVENFNIVFACVTCNTFSPRRNSTM